MKRIWNTPTGEYSAIYADMLAQTHLLIAGATGSGKSTVVNGMMHAALFHSPASIQFILIDPKGSELDEYKRLPHVIAYADMSKDPSGKPMQTCIDALDKALSIMHDRLNECKRKHIRMYDGSDIYVVIDELMILMTRAKKAVLPRLQDLLSLSRCVRIHVIGCTQSPIAKVLPTELKCNWDSRLALRTVCAQDSRNIIGIAGCETLPDPRIDHKASGIYRHGCAMDMIESLTLIPDTERQKVIDHWTKTKPKIRIFG